MRSMNRITAFFRALGRKLTPPGNRESLETSYRNASKDDAQTPTAGISQGKVRGEFH
jgi:hypothetical protein